MTLVTTYRTAAENLAPFNRAAFEAFHRNEILTKRQNFCELTAGIIALSGRCITLKNQLTRQEAPPPTLGDTHDDNA